MKSAALRRKQDAENPQENMVRRLGHAAIGIAAPANMIAALAIMFATTMRADTYYSVGADGSGQYSFRRANWKAAGDAAASEPVAGNYYVAVHTIRAGGLSSDAATDAFPGASLQIGEVGGTAGTMTIYKSGKVSVPNMILAKGCIVNGSSGWTAHVGGGVTTVIAPASDPFALGFAMSYTSYEQTYPITFDADHAFKGDGTVCIGVNVSKSRLTINGGSPDYLGKWTFKPARAMVVVLGSPEALGGNCTSYAADSIQLKAQGTTHRSALVFDFNGTMPSAGRGITLTQDWIMNVTTGKVECAMPITAGTSPKLTVAGGVDALSISTDGNYIPSAKTGYVSDGRDALMLGSVAVPTTLHSGTLCVTNFTGGTFTMRSKARLGARIHRDGTADATSFAAGTVFTAADAKISIHVYGDFPLTNSTTRIPVLKMPTSVCALTESDIELTADDFDLMEKTLEVVTDGGVQTVYLTMTGKVVYYSKYGDQAHYNMEAQYWSDNKQVHDDADYLIGYDVASSCRAIRGLGNISFKGKSLTMVPGSVFMTKGTPTAPSTVADMRCWSGSRITAAVIGTNVITGALSLRGNAVEGGVVFSVEVIDRSFRVDAGISGEIPIKIENRTEDYFTDYRTFEITSENPGFTGSLETVRYTWRTRGVRLVLHDELNLGGNPAAFNAAQLLFSCNTILEAADTLTLDDPNRGLTVNGPCTFAVGPGKSMTLDIPMVFNGFIAAGAMTKTGGGTLGIGGTVSGDSAYLTVSAGYVQPVTRTGSSTVKYTFADGSGLELALSPSDSDVAADGLYVSDASHMTIQGSSLPVVVKGAMSKGDKSVKLGIANVPSSMADSVGSALGEYLTFVNSASGNTRQCAIERETLDGDRVRFYAKVSIPGFVLIVR